MDHQFSGHFRRTIIIVTFAVAFFAFQTCVLGQSNSNEKQATASKRAAAAAKALEEIAALPSTGSIPSELLARAKVIAVFPNVSKINAIFQKAMKGSGLAARRTDDGWGTPIFYQFGTIDTGWTTAEAKSPTIVMLFLSEGSLADFKEKHIEIGGTIAGPIGASLTEAEKKRVESARSIAYGLHDGKLIGVKIEEGDSIQSGMHIDNAMNKPTYGAKGEDVFWTKAEAKGVPEIEEFRKALAKLK